MLDQEVQIQAVKEGNWIRSQLERNKLMKLLIALMLVNPFGLIINNKNAMNDTTIVTHADDKEWIYEKSGWPYV